LTHLRAIKCSSNGFLPGPSEETSKPTGEIIARANKEVEAEKKGL